MLDLVVWLDSLAFEDDFVEVVCLELVDLDA